MTFKKKYILYFILVLGICHIYCAKNYFLANISKYLDSIKSKLEGATTQETIFGSFDVQEQVIADALKNEALFRMQGVDQGGPLVYFNVGYSFTRFDHSLGVWSLVKMFGANEAEQLASLYHDISHTAFSHVADNIFKSLKGSHATGEHSHQDDIHLWYIENSPAMNICKKYNIPLENLDPDLPQYTMLERPLPAMCGDRIEYNLHTAIAYKILTLDEVKNIISHLRFEAVTYKKNNELITEKTWFFNDIVSAKKFALLPLHFIRTIWNSSFNMVLYKFFAYLIRYAFLKEYISKDLFHFGKDKDILDILYKSKDPYVIHMLKCLENIFNVFEIVDEDSNNFDEILKGKFRGIDPLIKINDEVKTLTEFDFDFREIYNLVQKDCKKGYKVKYKEIYDPEIFYATYKSN
jgi:hypothetical protein